MTEELIPTPMPAPTATGSSSAGSTLQPPSGVIATEAGQLPRIRELAAEIPEVSECHRITGEDCYFLKVYLRSIDELSSVLDRFLAYGETRGVRKLGRASDSPDLQAGSSQRTPRERYVAGLLADAAAGSD